MFLVSDRLFMLSDRLFNIRNFGVICLLPYCYLKKQGIC